MADIGVIGTTLVKARGESGFRHVGQGRIAAMQAAEKARGNGKDDIVVLAGQDAFAVSADAIEMAIALGQKMTFRDATGREREGEIVHHDDDGRQAAKAHLATREKAAAAATASAKADRLRAAERELQATYLLGRKAAEFRKMGHALAILAAPIGLVGALVGIPGALAGVFTAIPPIGLVLAGAAVLGIATVGALGVAPTDLAALQVRKRLRAEIEELER